jgi:L-tyrosine isonitrile synthase
MDQRTASPAGEKPSFPRQARSELSRSDDLPVPEKILRSFNTWTFKREQPSDRDLMLHFISEATRLAEPVPFVLYWGKGPRSRLAEPDTICLDYLKALTDRVRNVYEPGAALKLIFTDTHAELNGHSDRCIREYFADVANAAGRRGFGSCRLSVLPEAGDTLSARQLTEQNVSAETLRLLCASAAKWYRGERTADEAALAYFQMNLVERQSVELAFPRSIFLTFNGSQMRGLFPKLLPIFYMYSLRRGKSVKPWFMLADESDGADPIPECALPN